MKNLTKSIVLKVKSLALMTLFFLAAYTAAAQVTVVQFMKVQPGQWDTYLEVEKVWSELHQKSVDNGLLLAWSLHEKMFHGSDDEYDFITVNVFPDWETYEKGFPEGYFDQLGEEVMQKTGESRMIIRAEVYQQVASAKNSKPAKYTNLAFMKVEQGNAGKYVNMENKYFKVFHEGLIDAGGMNSWAIYQRIVPYGFGEEFNYVAANGYESLSQQSKITEETYNNAWETAASGDSDEDINKLTNESREMITSEMWRTVMAVSAEE